MSADGTPVYLMGDFNDKEPAFDKMTKDGLTKASAPADQRDNIDWIFGTGSTTFDDHKVRLAPKREDISDHPLIISETTY